jgi:hypothetical protein
MVEEENNEERSSKEQKWGQLSMGAGLEGSPTVTDPSLDREDSYLRLKDYWT